MQGAEVPHTLARRRRPGRRARRRQDAYTGAALQHARRRAAPQLAVDQPKPLCPQHARARAANAAKRRTAAPTGRCARRAETASATAAGEGRASPLPMPGGRAPAIAD
eukprot:13125962-Alexandrium_andersonii.AAC.1